MCHGWFGWSTNVIVGRCERGPATHAPWRTFERLSAEHEAFVTRSLAGIARRLGITVGN